jgi:hypothetical protein
MYQVINMGMLSQELQIQSFEHISVMLFEHFFSDTQQERNAKQ